jgi:ankyrin repeat protein
MYFGPSYAGRSVLMNAAASGYPDVVEIILKGRPDVNQRDDNGWTALHYATSGGGPSYSQAPPVDRVRVIELLIAAGADVNARNRGGKTPLALGEFDNDVANALLRAGAR